MTKRALLVGINYPGTDYALNGCVNDVLLMSDLITTHFGFTDAKNRRMLVDSSATTDNILERLEWLVDGCSPGDVLFFHYSGHGSQMINQNYDDPDFYVDGLDEVICPVDINWRNKVIRDDDLKRIFDKVPAGVNLTVILDCCHSGGGIDSINRYYPLGLRRFVAHHPDSTPNKSRLMQAPPDILNRGLALGLKSKPRKVQSGEASSAFLVSGCGESQTSSDTFINNIYAGAATFFIAKSLKDNNFDLSYSDLIDVTTGLLIDAGYEQQPELNGRSDLFQSKFLQPLV